MCQKVEVGKGGHLGPQQSSPWSQSKFQSVRNMELLEPLFLDLTSQDSPYFMKTKFLKTSGVAKGGACHLFRGSFVNENSLVDSNRAQKTQVVRTSDFS